LIAAADAPVAVRDVDGALLLGVADVGPADVLDEHPVRCEGETIGWVVGDTRQGVGGGQAASVAALLTHLAAREAEKDALCDEVLDMYREVNLLYNLSEKLAASLELGAVASLALDEAGRLIEGSGGAILLRDERTGAHEPVATFGQATQSWEDACPEGGIVREVASRARAEIVNDVRSDERGAGGEGSIRSLICAPLKSRDRAIGCIVLVSEAPVSYTAADLNLLNTVASQAAPAIENALLYEKALREAQERQERLEKQVEDLKIELNEAKQKQGVTEIIETEYFQRLRKQANHLRNIIGGEQG
jgi:GAF domain-containing protein